jgi:MoaA/NifB/PqqE/SkfB family radical SAM enzyme
MINAVPKEMLVGVTNRCNYKCIFCHHGNYDNKKGEIDTALLNRILNEAYDMGVRRVGLYSSGESFLCKNLAIHIRNAKEAGFEYIYLDTNGFLADNSRLRKVIAAGIDSIKFSINAGSNETYYLIHGINREEGISALDRILRNLKDCYELKKELNSKLKIIVSYVVIRQNEEEVEQLHRMVKPYINEFKIYPFVNEGKLENIECLLPLSINTVRPRMPCEQIFNRINVTYNGCLSACCSDFNMDLLLADLKTTPLKDAWNSKNAVKIREAHLWKNLDGLLCNCCAKGTPQPYKPLEI